MEQKHRIKIDESVSGSTRRRFALPRQASSPLGGGVGGWRARLGLVSPDDAVNIPATTISTAQVQALRTLGVNRVAVSGPYPTEVTQLLVQFLEGHGFEVTGSQSAGMETEWQIGNAPPSVWYNLAREVDSPHAECVLLACSGIRTAAIIEPLERDIGKPVVSAPAVSIWAALRLAGVNAPVYGRGVLLADH